MTVVSGALSPRLALAQWTASSVAPMALAISALPRWLYLLRISDHRKRDLPGDGGAPTLLRARPTVPCLTP